MGRLEDATRRASAEKMEREAQRTIDALPDGTAGLAADNIDSDELPSELPEPHSPAAVVDFLRPSAGPEPPARPVAATAPIAHAQPAAPAALRLPADDNSVAIAAAAADASLSARLGEGLQTKTVADEHMQPEAREQYRRLAAAFHQAQRTNGFKVAMVVSAVAGEGKSLTAANLALTLSGSYRKTVLLVDADLRRPSQHTVFQVPGAPGLTDGLTSIDEPRLPLHKVSERLTILPAGRPTSDPIGALTSERMRRLINEAREVFDWVIIDTPPVGLMTDAALMTSMADGVVLVVKAGSTPFELVRRAVDSIGSERLLGTVLNQATEQPHQSSYDYYRYYGPKDLTTT